MIESPDSTERMPHISFKTNNSSSVSQLIFAATVALLKQQAIWHESEAPGDSFGPRDEVCYHDQAAIQNVQHDHTLFPQQLESEQVTSHCFVAF